MSVLALDQEILDRFLQAAAEVDAPIASQLAPGLSDDEIDQVIGESGVVISEELRTLWRWRTAAPSPETPVGWMIHPNFELLPPERAIASTLTRRAGLYGWTPFKESWVAFATWRDPSYLVVDVDLEQNGVTPIIYRLEEATIAAAPSLGTLFSYWTEQITTGESYIDPRDLGWRARDDAREGWIQPS